MREVIRKIKAKYKYNHLHGNASIKCVMKQLATTGKQQDRLAVAAPNGMANMVTEKLQQIVMGDNGEESDLFTSHEESVMAATTESKSSAEKPARRVRKTITSSRG